MLRKSASLSLAFLLFAGCSSGQVDKASEPNVAASAERLPEARAHLAPSSARHEYIPASVVVSPGAHCELHPEGSADAAQNIPVPVGYDGVARFHAVRATSADDVQRLALDCTSPMGETTTYPVDLRSEATFAVRPIDLGQAPGTERPALSRDPRSYSEAELLRLGYGLRPDPERSATAYARWLASATRPARRLRADPFGRGLQPEQAAPLPDPSERETLVPETTSVGTAPPWIGALLHGAPTYVLSQATFAVPTPLEVGAGNTHAAVWTGLGGYGYPQWLIQDGIWISTTPSSFSLFSFAEYCCGDNPAGLHGLPAIVPEPGDTVFVQAWYCDANGNVNANIGAGGGYGCTIIHDETTGALNSCTVYNDPSCSSAPPLNTWPSAGLGATAEFIMERSSYPLWPDFPGTLSMSGEAETSTGSWETVSSDPSVLLLQDSQPAVNLDHESVSITGSDTVNWTTMYPATFPGIYRPSDGNWILNSGNVPAVAAGTSGTTTTVAYGAPSDVPVSGQWTTTTANPGTDTIGVFRPAGAAYNTCSSGQAQWLLRNSITAGSPNESFCFGVASDEPLVGDWTDIGVSAVGVYRYAGAPSNTCSPTGQAQWYLRSANGSGAPTTFCYGGPLDRPVVGDWDGNGTTTIGVFRPANTLYNTCAANEAQWLLRNENSNGAPDISFCYGGVGDTPVVGDWNNDGVTSIGVFREADTQWNPSTSNEWLLRDSNTAGSPNFQFYFGALGDIPVLMRQWL